MKYIAGDGDHLRDLVATVSELRHCPTFAAPDAVVALECPNRVKIVEEGPVNVLSNPKTAYTERLVKAAFEVA